MKKHIIGLLILAAALVLVPIAVHLLQINVLPTEEQFTQIQSIYVGWFFVGGFVLLRSIRSWFE